MDRDRDGIINVVYTFQIRGIHNSNVMVDAQYSVVYTFQIRGIHNIV